MTNRFLKIFFAGIFLFSGFFSFHKAEAAMTSGYNIVPNGYALTAVGYGSDDQECWIYIKTAKLNSDKTVSTRPQDISGWRATRCENGGGNDRAEPFFEVPSGQVAVGWVWEGNTDGGGNPVSPDLSPDLPCAYQEYTKIITIGTPNPETFRWGSASDGTCDDRGYAQSWLKVVSDEAPPGEVIVGIKLSLGGDADVDSVYVQGATPTPYCGSGRIIVGDGSCAYVAGTITANGQPSITCDAPCSPLVIDWDMTIGRDAYVERVDGGVLRFSENISGPQTESSLSSEQYTYQLWVLSDIPDDYNLVDSATVTVEEPPPPITPVACNPSSQTVQQGNQVNFSASGGNGSFNWSAPGSDISTGSGATFSTGYSNTNGSPYAVTVWDASDSSNSDTCSVSVTPSSKPVISLSPTSFSFNAARFDGSSSPQNGTLYVGNTGGAVLNWNSSVTYSPNSGSNSWLQTISPSSRTIQPGGANQSILLTPQPSTLSAGTYTATVTVSDSPNNPDVVDKTVTITLVVNDQPPGAFSLSGSSCNSGGSKVYLSWSASQNVSTYDVYRSTGGGNSIKINSSSLSASAASYTDSNVNPNTNYTYFVRATNGNGSTDSNSVNITASSAQCGSFNFSLSNSGSRSVGRTGSVSNTITVALVSGNSQPVALSASPDISGVTYSFSQPSCSPTCYSTLTITTNNANDGSYTIAVTGSGGGVTQSTNIPLTIGQSQGGACQLSPDSFNFTAARGGFNPDPKTMSIFNWSSGPARWRVDSVQHNWLSAGPSSGPPGNTILGNNNFDTTSLNVNSSGMNEGTYANYVTVALTNYDNGSVVCTATADVMLTVVPPPPPPGPFTLNQPTGACYGPGYATHDMTVSWSASTGATSYDIYRNGVYLGNSPNNSFIDRGIDGGQTGIYEVFARNAGAERTRGLTADRDNSVSKRANYCYGDMVVNAKNNGVDWNGQVTFTLTSPPFTNPNYPPTYGALPMATPYNYAGTGIPWALTYSSRGPGPGNTAPTSITPSNSQTIPFVSEGYFSKPRLNFTMNFGAPPAPEPDFGLNKNRDMFVNIVGTRPVTSTSAKVTVSSFDGFSHRVNLSLQSISPTLSGASVNLTKSGLDSSEYSSGSDITVTVPAATPSGLYTVNIQGMSQGKIRTISPPILLRVNSRDPSFKEI